LLIDHRTYLVRPFTLRKQLALFNEHGFPVVRKYIGEPLGIFVPTAGDINSYIHIWVFEDHADRTRRRALMEKDPAWHAFLERAAQANYIVHQESRLMVPSELAAVPWPRIAPLPDLSSH
jgi:hypothetical protein